MSEHQGGPATQPDERPVRLVMGASGFLGSHVTRQLVQRGDRVRVWVRPSSSTAAFDDLDVEVVRGELTDAAALRAAMADVACVFYSIVDTRAWLHDTRPLFRTNVALLEQVLAAVEDAGVPRFVFCSTVGTIGIADRGRLADESTPHTWEHLGGDYIRSRRAAEELVLTHHRERGLPAVVLNVSTTYGPRDLGPTPHGTLLKAATRRKMPAYVRGAAMEVVGIEDAARAFLLAEEHGRPGERYIVSESMMPIRDVFAIAADEAGVPPPRIGVPLPVLRLIGRAGGAWAALRRTDAIVNPVSVRLMHIMSPLDHGKATRELGWRPRPTEESIREAARWFRDRDAARRAATDLPEPV